MRYFFRMMITKIKNILCENFFSTLNQIYFLTELLGVLEDPILSKIVPERFVSSSRQQERNRAKTAKYRKEQPKTEK